MYNMQLNTGYAGKPHVTAENCADLNRGLLGSDSYVLPVGTQFEVELVTNNLLKIKDGCGCMQGRQVSIAKGQIDEITIENGTQGEKRIDLVVIRYSKNPDTGIETAIPFLIKGIPSEMNPVRPLHLDGDIRGGDLTVDWPLYELYLDGISVTDVKPLFDILMSVDELNRKLLPWDAWRQSFLGTHIYRLQFGDINGNIIQTNQLSIPWLPSEVTVALSKINIPGAGTIAIDYKSAYLTTEGGLYIYCSTAGAAGVASLKWQVVDATIVIQRK